MVFLGFEQACLGIPEVRVVLVARGYQVDREALVDRGALVDREVLVVLEFRAFQEVEAAGQGFLVFQEVEEVRARR